MMRTSNDSGQAAVESALTLPLVVFLFLGTLQLMLLLQARVLAEYAVFRAVRVGSTNSARCGPMMDAAVLVLMPSFDSFVGRGGDPGADLAARFRRYSSINGYRYSGLAYDHGTFNGRILLMERTFARPVDTAAEHDDFDEPGFLQRLDTRMVFWYPMRIPFANWVISKMVLGYSAANPLMSPQTAQWQRTSLGGLAQQVANRAALGEYVLPIVARYSMRMMSPVTDDRATCGGT